MPAYRSFDHPSDSSSPPLSVLASPRPIHRHALQPSWSALPTPTASPTNPDRIPAFSTRPLPADLFTREYLQPAIHYPRVEPAQQTRVERPQQQQAQQPSPARATPGRHSRPPSSPSPSAFNHKVYEILCRCDALLTDRGMRAVLLLRPHITLYSTDCMPISTGTLPAANDGTPDAGRTCSCLTQSFGCLCCGALVGYHILSPCEQCTASQRQSRAANGHRFVFHSGAVHARERLYSTGQTDIRPSSSSPKSAASSACSSRSVSPNPERRLPSSTAELGGLDHYLATTGSGRKSVPSFQLDPAPASGSRASSRVPSRSPSPAPGPPADLQPGANVLWRHLVTAGDLHSVVPPSAADRRCATDERMLSLLGLPFGHSRPAPLR